MRLRHPRYASGLDLYRSPNLLTTPQWLRAVGRGRRNVQLVHVLRRSEKMRSQAGVLLLCSAAFGASQLGRSGDANAQPRQTVPTESAAPSTNLASSSGGLTADEVAIRAQETSFDAAARREAIAAAEARVDQAYVAYYPKLALTGRYARLSHVSQPLQFGPPGT